MKIVSRTRLLGLVVLGLGAVLGYAAGTGKLSSLLRGEEKDRPAPDKVVNPINVPGSPSATATIDGRYLPPPPAEFGGEINLNAHQSKPYWPPRVVPPRGRPTCCSS